MIEHLVVIRGAGDLATGCALRLHNAGFPIVMLEIENPTVIRRTVSFAQALYSTSCEVEGVKALCMSRDKDKVLKTAYQGLIPVVADAEGLLIDLLKPDVVIDAIIAKKNLGTTKNMAPLTIALGPGFNAPEDVNVVIETKRGHTLGRAIRQGCAIKNTGIPGIIAGYGKERVIHSPCEGVFTACREIGDIVCAGEKIGSIGSVEVKSVISGKLRGLIISGSYVPCHFKIADVDPRGEEADHTTCSDKAMAIAGGVLEVVMNFFYGKF